MRNEPKQINSKPEAHISDLEWSRFWQDQMTPDEQATVLEHTSGCEWCSGRMAALLPEENTLTAPAYFQEETVAYVKKQTRLYRLFGGRRFRFTLYCMKVGLVAACALFLVLSVPLPQNNRDAGPVLPPSGAQEAETYFSLPGVLNFGSNFINRKLYEFSDQLLNIKLSPDREKEVPNHEKQK